MTLRRKLKAGAGAMLLLVSPGLHAAVPCIPRQQVADMTVALMPPLIEEARETCGNRLPAEAFINTAQSNAMATRFVAAAKTRTASAAQGLRQLGDMQMPEGVTDATLVKLMGEMLPSMLFKAPDADVCGNLNAVLESLAPLSPDQSGRLIASFFALADVKSPSICKP
jgi:hypothetical protein